MRKTAISTGVVGLILLVASALLAWWITPSYIARMPSDYNKTRTYDATIRTLFNPAALQAGNLAGAIRTGLPATLSHHVKVASRSHEVDEQDFAALRGLGITDEDIWDIGAITALFALSNRMANLMALRPNDQFYLMGRGPAPKSE